MVKNKILIIDEDAGFVEAAASMLEANGYDVECSHDGCEGFDKARHIAPDLILLDIVTASKHEGVGVAACFGQDASLKDIPVIIVSSPDYMSADDVSKQTNLTVKTVMEKPVNLQELLQTVRTYISRTGEKHREMVEEVTTLVKRWEGKKGSLIMILHELQNHYSYVPRDVAFTLSQILDVPMAQIYEVITFYNFFKLSAPGKNIVSVCLGTACYLKGAPQLIDEFKKELNVNEGQTTKDGLFYLQIVRCLGCCGLSPVVMINEKVYGKVSREEVKTIIDEYRKKG